MASEPEHGIEPASGKEPATAVDYHSVLSNVIASVMKDPARMRSMIYEFARMTLRREAWNTVPAMRTGDIRNQLDKLEEAIARVELEAQAAKLPEYIPPERIADDRDPSSDREMVVLSERPSLAQASQVFHVAPPKPRWYFGFHLIGLLQLFAASFIGVATFAYLTGQFGFGGAKPAPQAPIAQPAAPTPPAQPAAPPAPPEPALPFAMPANYGVYALNNGELVELDRMPMRMPDPRVQLSPDIKLPIRVVLPDGKPTFVVYRRDLVTSAPEKVPARVVARVARELTFKDGKAATNTVEGVWRVRNISYDLRVAPVGNKGEMIMISPDAGTELPAGRYALVLSGLGYDFSIAGPIATPEQCLERSETTGPPIFTDCKMP